jgi:hypothetical protein
MKPVWTLFFYSMQNSTPSTFILIDEIKVYSRMDITVRRALKEIYKPALKAISASMITRGFLTPINYSKLDL